MIQNLESILPGSSIIEEKQKLIANMYDEYTFVSQPNKANTNKYAAIFSNKNSIGYNQALNQLEKIAIQSRSADIFTARKYYTECVDMINGAIAANITEKNVFKKIAEGANEVFKNYESKVDIAMQDVPSFYKKTLAAGIGMLSFPAFTAHIFSKGIEYQTVWLGVSAIMLMVGTVLVALGLSCSKTYKKLVK